MQHILPKLCARRCRCSDHVSALHHAVHVSGLSTRLPVLGPNRQISCCCEAFMVHAAAESVHVDSSGALHMLDKFGNYVTSKLDQAGSYSSFQQVAFLGPSRPLGFDFDSSGNLIVCDATIVSRCKYVHAPVTPLQVLTISRSVLASPWCSIAVLDAFGARTDT